MSLVEVNAVNDSFDCLIQWSIIKQNIGRLAAQFQGEALAG